MIHPDVQAKLMLSFQDEKLKEAEARRAEGWKDDGDSWQSRLLSASGDLLINAGSVLKRHADGDNLSEPATSGA
jgi:hypothetical protein